MSKRLSKRQQREQEELEMLKAEQERAGAARASTSKAQPASEVEQDNESEDEDEDEPTTTAPLNAFAAVSPDTDVKTREIELTRQLGQGEEDQDEDEEEEEVQESKKKKKNKKKKASAAATPGDDVDEDVEVVEGKKGSKGAKTTNEMDEVDRALAELNIKYGSARGESSTPTAKPATAESKGFVAFRFVHPHNTASGKSLTIRNLLSVDPKNLDAEAELRRFFGSKVISSSEAATKGRRGGPSAKLRYTISKPKPNYPPATSLAGLGMRELRDEEVTEWYERRGYESSQPGEKWFTFEHSGQWREIERQFLGAVRSHDPNELMALLSVYPWHVDTLLQMSEVYRLQSDIGAASDYAERALYAFDRCLMPSFSVTTGASRLDFDRVENRPMFTALHRIISYLGRRGCWVTAFNFTKLLYSLDPQGDPHGAAFWLDFLAVKSNNSAWLLSMFEQEEQAAVVFDGYPGMAYAKALALRNQEISSKSKDRSASEVALQAAMWTFPQVIPLLADKIGATLPDGARSHPLLNIEAGYSVTPLNTVHLLSHIYVSRSEALWKDPDMLSFFESQVPSAMAQLETEQAASDRDHVLSLLEIPRDPVDEQLKLPLFICRHVVCSESTSWIGFLPPQIRNEPVHAFDPLPPTTAISMYDNEYFSGVPTRSRGAGAGGGGQLGFLGEMIGRLNQVMEEHPEGWQDRIAGVWREMTGRRELAGVPQEQRDNMLQQLLQIAGQAQLQPPGEARGMPGAFPGQERDEA